MRAVFLCLFAAVGALALTEIASDGHSSVLAPEWRHAPSIDRSGKGDPAGMRIPAPPEHNIATVEVIGVESAAVVFRDRSGNVLFRTDPVENTTVVVRGLPLPQVTLRESSQVATQSMKLDEPAADPAHPQEEKGEREGKTETLLDGCEGAASPLSPLGHSTLRARCVTQLGTSPSFG